MNLISIIIPTYNSSDTLLACLQSVCNQTYSGIEIVVVDGLSSDNTVNIIKDISSRCKNIVWVSEKDKGIYDAMNKGISMASGNWLYFLGSDDYLLDNEVILDVAKKLNDTSANLVYGDAVVVSDKSCRGGEFSLHKLLTEGNLCHQTIFYKKAVFDVLGKYNLKYPIIADWDFNIRCFQNPDIITEYIHRSIVLYNDVTGISSTSRNDHFYNLVPATYIKELGATNLEKQAILQSAEYKIGKTIYNILKSTGIIKVINKIR